MMRIALALVFSLFACFAQAAEPQVGRDYALASPPQNTMAGKGKIEVIEFFSYACPHCKAFNPLVTQWVAKLPKDVVFRKVPVTFGNKPWVVLSKLHYALDITGDLPRLEEAVFQALHVERKFFRNDDEAVAWAVSKGVDGKKIAEAMSSFSTVSRLQRGDQEAAAFRIEGVPTLAINGRYVVNSQLEHTAQLAIADQLIAKARQEQKGK